MNNRIDGYLVNYFEKVARQCWDNRMAGLGFEYLGIHRDVTAYWGSESQFITAGYLPETMPHYELLFGVGERDGDPLQPVSSSNSVGVWRLLPPEMEPEIANWRFEDEQSLERQLKRAWEAVIVPFVIPVLENDGLLSEAIDAYSDELDESDMKLMDDRLVRHARAAFDAGRYLDAVHTYSELPEDALTSADRKRIEIARGRS